MGHAGGVGEHSAGGSALTTTTKHLRRNTWRKEYFIHSGPKLFACLYRGQSNPAPAPTFRHLWPLRLFWQHCFPTVHDHVNVSDLLRLQADGRQSCQELLPPQPEPLFLLAQLPEGYQGLEGVAHCACVVGRYSLIPRHSQHNTITVARNGTGEMGNFLLYHSTNIYYTDISNLI